MGHYLYLHLPKSLKQNSKRSEVVISCTDIFQFSWNQRLCKIIIYSKICHFLGIWFPMTLVQYELIYQKYLCEVNHLSVQLKTWPLFPATIIPSPSTPSAILSKTSRPPYKLIKNLDNHLNRNFHDKTKESFLKIPNLSRSDLQ